MLRRNTSLAKPAIEELLGYTSPVEMATERYAREVVEIAGATIPGGELILAVLGLANHDENLFEDPDTPGARPRPKQAPRLRAGRCAPLPGGTTRPDGRRDSHESPPASLPSRAFGGGLRNPTLAAGVVPARIGEVAARIAPRAKAPKGNRKGIPIHARLY